MTPKQENQRRTLLTAAHLNYEKGLHLRAFFKMGDRLVGEDMVQDTFLKTWRYLVKGRKIEVMKSFLHHVLNGLIVDEYRKRKYQATSLDILIEGGFEPGAEDLDDYTRSNTPFKIKYGKAAIFMIQRLPEKYRAVMRMKYIQDLSPKEMSLITGQSKNAIGVQLHRGLKMLQLLYKPVEAIV